MGGTVGHCLCTGLAVIGGRMIAQRISVRTGEEPDRVLHSSAEPDLCWQLYPLISEQKQALLLIFQMQFCC